MDVLRNMNALVESSVQDFGETIQFLINVRAKGLVKNSNNQLVPAMDHQIQIEINRDFPYPGGIKFLWRSPIFHPTFDQVRAQVAGQTGDVFYSRGYHEIQMNGNKLVGEEWIPDEHISEMRIHLSNGELIQALDTITTAWNKIKACEDDGGRTTLVDRKVVRFTLRFGNPRFGSKEVTYNIVSQIQRGFGRLAEIIATRVFKHPGTGGAILPYIRTPKKVITELVKLSTFSVEGQREEGHVSYWTLSYLKSREVIVVVNMRDQSISIGLGNGWDDVLGEVPPEWRGCKRYVGNHGSKITRLQDALNAASLHLGFLASMSSRKFNRNFIASRDGLGEFRSTISNPSMIEHVAWLVTTKEQAALAAIASPVHEMFEQRALQPSSGFFMAGTVNDVVDVRDFTTRLNNVNLGIGIPRVDTSPAGTMGTSGLWHDWVYYKLVSHGMPITARVNWKSGMVQYFLGHVEDQNGVPAFAIDATTGHVVMNPSWPGHVNPDGTTTPACPCIGAGLFRSPGEAGQVFDMVAAMRDTLQAHAPRDDNNVALASITPLESAVSRVEWLDGKGTLRSGLRTWSTFRLAVDPSILPAGSLPSWCTGGFEMRLRENPLSPGETAIDLWTGTSFVDMATTFGGYRSASTTSTGDVAPAVTQVNRWMQALGQSLSAYQGIGEGDVRFLLCNNDGTVPYSGDSLPFTRFEPVHVDDSGAISGAVHPGFVRPGSTATIDGQVGVQPVIDSRNVGNGQFVAYLPAMFSSSSGPQSPGHYISSATSAGKMVARADQWASIVALLRQQGDHRPLDPKAGKTKKGKPLPHTIDFTGGLGAQAGIPMHYWIQEGYMVVGESTAPVPCTASEVADIKARLDEFIGENGMFPASKRVVGKDHNKFTWYNFDGSGRGPAELGYEILVPVEGCPVVEGCPAACIRLVLSGAYKGQYLLASFKKLGSDGKWVVIDSCDYTSVDNRYAHFTKEAIDKLFETVNALGTVMASGDVEIVASYAPQTISSMSTQGKIVLAFLVKLAGQATPEQLAIFEITVNGQAGGTSIEVKFKERANKEEETYRLDDPMTCFPGVRITKKLKFGTLTIPIVEETWRQTPVFHPTFHEWVHDTFSGLPGYDFAEHLTPKFFMDYMRHISGLAGFNVLESQCTLPKYAVEP